MAPLGGLFVGCMGLFVLLGSFSRKARMRLVALLGVACATNALVAWKRPSYGEGAAWFADGTLKLAFGVMLIATSAVV